MFEGTHAHAHQQITFIDLNKDELVLSIYMPNQYFRKSNTLDNISRNSEMPQQQSKWFHIDVLSMCIMECRALELRHS